MTDETGSAGEPGGASGEAPVEPIESGPTHPWTRRRRARRRRRWIRGRRLDPNAPRPLDPNAVRCSRRSTRPPIRRRRAARARPGRSSTRARTSSPRRGPGLGCFRFQVIVLVVLIVLTPLTVAWDWPPAVSAALLFIVIFLLLDHRPDDHLPAAPGRRRPPDPPPPDGQCHEDGRGARGRRDGRGRCLVPRFPRRSRRRRQVTPCPPPPMTRPSTSRSHRATRRNVHGQNLKADTGSLLARRRRPNCPGHAQRGGSAQARHRIAALIDRIRAWTSHNVLLVSISPDTDRRLAPGRSDPWTAGSPRAAGSPDGLLAPGPPAPGRPSRPPTPVTASDTRRATLRRRRAPDPTPSALRDEADAARPTHESRATTMPSGRSPRQHRAQESRGGYPAERGADPCHACPPWMRGVAGARTRSGPAQAPARASEARPPSARNRARAPLPHEPRPRTTGPVRQYRPGRRKPTLVSPGRNA